MDPHPGSGSADAIRLGRFNPMSKWRSHDEKLGPKERCGRAA